MTKEEILSELTGLANQIVNSFVSGLSEDPLSLTALFIETVRARDYWSAIQEKFDWTEEKSRQHFDLMQVGWNQAALYLLKNVDSEGVPLMQTDSDTIGMATSIMINLGLSVTIRRVITMVQTGLMDVEKHDRKFTFKKHPIMDLQSFDLNEENLLHELEAKLEELVDQREFGWDIVGIDEIGAKIHQPGNFLSGGARRFPRIEEEELMELMRPLVKPWDSGRGILMSYGGNEQVDYHYLGIAVEVVKKWQLEAGFGSDIKIGNVSGADIAIVVTCLTSFYLKHIGFVNIAVKDWPQINIPMSLPIWTPTKQLIADISDWTQIEPQIVEQVFDIIIFKPSEVSFLKNHTSKFIPLLIGLSNGFVLRPFSSILRNPFFSLISVMEYRDPNVRHQIGLPRESWLRNNLYAIFSGTRYQLVQGNIKLRKAGRIITDIDAAILDNLTGELALFQIKWQDFFFNDVKKLRSKASNLVKEVDEWAARTDDWIRENGKQELAKSLRIKTDKYIHIKSVYLFAIGATQARMEGYGFSVKYPAVALSTWAHFARLRFVLGPAPQVISLLFERLKAEQQKSQNITPLPVTFFAQDKELEFLDLYGTFEEEGKK